MVIEEGQTLQALRQAILRRSPPKGLICHSDRGVQYAGNNFKTLLAQHEIIGSMSKKGDCWDNAVAESFFHTFRERSLIKVEKIWLDGKILFTREHLVWGISL